jgi:trans-2,3-dihydro-3-hydroxyanthranilate isomerase
MRAYVIADVFTDVPLEGNAVAVFTDGDGLSPETMQRAARELNLSETVFLLPGDDEAEYRTRIFTPTQELPFAGHPVLGTAFVVGEWSRGHMVRLRTGVGVVTVALQRRGGTIVFGEMEQPIPTWEAMPEPEALLKALGVERSELPIEVYTNGPRHILVELPDGSAVAGLQPNVRALAALGAYGISCFSHWDGQVKTRMFGPGMGVVEDPATGSAAGPLAVHLVRHGQTAFGDRIEIRQGVEIARPSVLHAVAEGSGNRIDRVAVGGSAVLVARGEFQLD